MAGYLQLTTPERQPGFTRRPLLQDVLYSYFRFRDLALERLASKCPAG